MPTKTTMQTQDIVDVSVTVEKLIAGGNGLARLEDGRVAFVDKVVPGETIKGNLTKQQNRWMIEQPTILEASPNRQDLKCQHANHCGGCDWQHMNDSTQQHWKERLVHEAFVRIGKQPEPPIDTIITNATWAYRTTVTWDVGLDTAQAPKLAYHLSKSNHLLTFHECPTLAIPLQKVAEQLNKRTKFLSHLKNQQTRIKARCNEAGQVLIGFESTATEPPPQELLDSLLKDNSDIIGIYAINKIPGKQAKLIAGQPTLTDTIANHSFEYALDHFMQTHPGVTEQLITWIQTHLATAAHNSRILDLYCGIGVLSLPLLLQDQTVVGIEGSKTAINLANKNAELHSKSAQATFSKMSVEAYCQTTTDEQFDIAICDPPRNGIKPEVLHWLSQHITSTLIYVSCDSATLARDAKLLIEQGWQLVKAQPLDMFPQTSHVETVCLFERSKVNK